MARVVVVVIEGGYDTFQTAVKATNANIPVLVFAGSGKAADFIAAAYDRREQPLVLRTSLPVRLLDLCRLLMFPSVCLALSNHAHHQRVLFSAQTICAMIPVSKVG